MNWFLLVFPLAGMFSQLLPSIAVGRRWHSSDAARRWIAVFGVVWFLADVLQVVVSRLRHNNLWLAPFINPVEDALTLWILSLWQLSPRARLAFRAAIPCVLLTYLIVVYLAGEGATFQTFAGPFRGLVILAATLFTLVSRIAREPEGAFARDWAWVTTGMALYYAISAVEEPIAAAIGPNNRAALLAMFCVHSTLVAASFVLIWRGVRFPTGHGAAGMRDPAAVG